MIPKECKRLAEVDFPIAVVSRHSAREKSIRHGHPSTLHLWWARRPLAACRAMLLALLLPDPCDPNCPADFKEKARRLLLGIYNQATETGDEKLRAALLKFIGDFANWDNAAKAPYFEAGRGLVKAAHGEETPLVVDPFAGGGSIPLEALRLGCDAFASDLNPVACLMLKVTLEDIPRQGPELADELRKVGAEIKKQAEKELAQYYPPDPDRATPIAYLWARTVTCESPNCGAEIPLVRSFWLCKKASRLRALRYDLKRPKEKSPYLEFEVFQPKSENEVPRGPVARGNATCPTCNTALAVSRVRAQLRQQRGDADAIFDAKGKRIGGARLLAVVTVRDDTAGRQYRVTIDRDYQPVWKVQHAVAQLAKEKMPNGLSRVPDEPLPKQNTLGLRVPNYGFTIWTDLFSSRQKLSLCVLASAVSRLPIEREASPAEQRLLALAVSRTADYCSANCSLHAGRDVVRNTWARNALPIVWDYYESVPWAESSGAFGGAIEWVAEVVKSLTSLRAQPGQVTLGDACDSLLPRESADIWFTDPPLLQRDRLR
jgi:putative DNA methylase